MLRITLLTAASVLAIASAHAADVSAPSPANNSPTAFQGAIASIKNWFGSDAPVTVQPIAGYDGMSPEAAAAANSIEPAAGDDLLQAPPAYTGVDANAIEPAAGEDAATPPAASAIAPAAPSAAAPATCKADEGDTATICAEPKADAVAPSDAMTPASDPEMMTPATPLPSTQPAAGTPTPASPAAAPMPVPAKAQ